MLPACPGSLLSVNVILSSLIHGADGCSLCHSSALHAQFRVAAAQGGCGGATAV